VVERRIRQLRRIYEQSRDVDVLVELLQAENRAYVQSVWSLNKDPCAQRQTGLLNQALEREGNQVYVPVPPMLCDRRAAYLKSLWEGVLNRPVRVSIQPPAFSPGTACRIALHLPLEEATLETAD
jgi:hypothetical protein